MDLSLGQAPHNSMDLAPVDLACPTLPLTVDLLVIFEDSRHRADRAPLVHLFHLVQDPMDLVDLTAHPTAAPRDLMDPISS